LGLGSGVPADTAGWIGVYGSSYLAPSGGGAAYIPSAAGNADGAIGVVASGSGITAQVILTRPVYADFTAIKQDTVIAGDWGG
jgi:hypothetical protein